MFPSKFQNGLEEIHPLLYRKLDEFHYDPAFVRQDTPVAEEGFRSIGDFESNACFHLNVWGNPDGPNNFRRHQEFSY